MSAAAPDEASLAELRLLCEVARLDGTVTTAERRFLFANALIRGIHPAEARGVLAEVEARSGKAQISLPPGDRPAVIRALLAAACADGELSPRERAFVDRVAKGLGVPASAVDEGLATAMVQSPAAKARESLGPDPGPPPRRVPPGAHGNYFRSALGYLALLPVIAFFVVLPAASGGNLNAGLLAGAGLLAVAFVLYGAVWMQRARLLRRGEAVEATARVVREIRRKRKSGEPRVVGLEVFYTYRVGEHRGQSRVVLRPEAPIERGDRLWAFVDRRSPAHVVVDPRWW